MLCTSSKYPKDGRIETFHIMSKVFLNKEMEAGSSTAMHTQQD